MVVATYLRNRWIKPGKWHLGGKRRSLRFYLTGFGLDPMPLSSHIEGKQRGLSRSLYFTAALHLLHFRVILAHVEKKPVQHYTLGFLFSNFFLVENLRKKTVLHFVIISSGKTKFSMATPLEKLGQSKKIVLKCHRYH